MIEKTANQETPAATVGEMPQHGTAGEPENWPRAEHAHGSFDGLDVYPDAGRPGANTTAPTYLHGKQGE
jgi:hypothetical protein